jgi:hypothetical protein
LLYPENTPSERSLADMTATMARENPLWAAADVGGKILGKDNGKRLVQTGENMLSLYREPVPDRVIFNSRAPPEEEYEEVRREASATRPQA